MLSAIHDLDFLLMCAQHRLFCPTPSELRRGIGLGLELGLGQCHLSRSVAVCGLWDFVWKVGR
jgi:hypothetical protein